MNSIQTEDRKALKGSGIFRLFLDLEKNVAEKCAINFKFSGKKLFFVVYFKNKKVVKLGFSGEGLDLNSALLKASLEKLSDSFDGAAVEIFPLEEFSAFGTEEMPLSAVEGFA